MDVIKPLVVFSWYTPSSIVPSWICHKWIAFINHLSRPRLSAPLLPSVSYRAPCVWWYVPILDWIDYVLTRCPNQSLCEQWLNLAHQSHNSLDQRPYRSSSYISNIPSQYLYCATRTGQYFPASSVTIQKCWWLSCPQPSTDPVHVWLILFRNYAGDGDGSPVIPRSHWFMARLFVIRQQKSSFN